MDAPGSTPILPGALPVPASAPAGAGAVPALSVILVNYQNWDDTLSLVRQLRSSAALREGDAEIVVLDNNSPSHPFLPRLRRLPGVALRRWRRNRGFARAVNEGCRLSRGDWLLLLNPDMTLDSGFLDAVLQRCVALAERDPHTGIIGYRLRHGDGSPQLSTGRFPTLAGTLGRLLLPRSWRKYTRPASDSAPSPVDWVTGCCLLVRRTCWESLGGFDSDFFLYYEDVDLCRRARACGWSVWFDPWVSTTHHRPLHSRPIPAHLRLITRHALLTYARKHWPPWQFRLLARLVRLEGQARALLARAAGDPEAATLFAEMAGITACLADRAPAGPAAGNRRLLRLVWEREERCGAPALRHHSQPQPG